MGVPEGKAFPALGLGRLLAAGGIVIADVQVLLIQLDEPPGVPADGEAGIGLDKPVDGDRPLLAGGDGVDGELLAGVGCRLYTSPSPRDS